MTDPTEASIEERLEQKRKTLAELQLSLRTKEVLAAELFYEASDAIALLYREHPPISNPSYDRLFDGGVDEDWQETWEFTDLKTGKRLAIEELGGGRILAGGDSSGYEEIQIKTPRSEKPTPVASNFGPIPGGAIVMLRDISARLDVEAQVKSQVALLAEKNEEHQLLIERLRAAVDELATPILHVAQGVLVVPIIGVVDSQRASLVAERLLSEIARDKAHSVVLDVTGVEVLDTTTADHLARLARAVSLLGARCVLCGVQPEVAQTLVSIGVQFDALVPRRNLAHALDTVVRDHTKRAGVASSPQAQ